MGLRRLRYGRNAGDRWLWISWAGLETLRRKHPRAFRALRRRVRDPLHWPTVAAAADRIIAGAEAVPAGERYRLDPSRLCALICEAFAWWAIEERHAVAGIRAAADDLLDLERRIDAAVTELDHCLTRSAALQSQFGLRVNSPMFAGDLGDALREAAHRYVRWGQEPEVQALIELESRSWYSPRPAVVDLVLIARNLGALRTVAATPPLRGAGGEWLRTDEPWVSAADPQSAVALAAAGPGSGAGSEQAQLRALFAALREIALRNGWDEVALAPIKWLGTDRDVSDLCRIAVGDAQGNVLDRGFEAETVQKARAAFLKPHA